MRYALPVSAYFLAALFGFAGADKVAHFDGFENALSSYVLVPIGIAPYLAPSVIVAEIWVALGLIYRPWRKVAALMSAALLGIFTVALVVNYFWAPGSICGCWFTITVSQASEVHIFQNLVLLGLALTVWHGESREGINLEEAAVPALSVVRKSKLSPETDRILPT